jgi:hypothetical protein
MLSATGAPAVQPNARIDCCAHATPEVDRRVKIAFRSTGRYLGDLSGFSNDVEQHSSSEQKMGMLHE